MLVGSLALEVAVQTCRRREIIPKRKMCYNRCPFSSIAARSSLVAENAMLSSQIILKLSPDAP
jgi:hypothetical protein